MWGHDMKKDVYLSFDLWNTLIKPNPAYKAARTKLLSQRFDIEESRVEQAHIKLKKLLDEMNNHGISLGARECWEMMCVALGGRRDDHLFQSMQTIAYEHAPFIEPALVRWFNGLAHDFNVSILSNTNMISGQTLLAILRKHGIDTSKVKAYFSDEIGLAKPNVRFFEYLEFPVDADGAAHVGDTFVTDGIGAQQYGIDFVMTPGPEQTVQIVESYLAHWRQ